MRAELTLTSEVVMKNDFATLWYYPDCNIIHHKFHKFIYGDAFREVLTKGAEYFEQYHCTKWLSDDRENSAIRPDDIEWGQSYWTPRMARAGWKYWAILMPDKVVGKMNMRRIIADYKSKGLMVEIFDDEKEALQWLKDKE